jgi:hypothetical protein
MHAPVSFHNVRHPAERTEAQINAFRTPLAVNTTMLYTHVLNRGPSGVRRPADGLGEGGAYDDPHNMPE